MVKKLKFTIASIGRPDYIVVEYTKRGRKELATTKSKAMARKKLIMFANKKQSTNIYIEIQVAGSVLK